MTSAQNIKPSEKYKDRLFRAIFDDPEHRDWLLSLYNAVNGSHYTNISLHIRRISRYAGFYIIPIFCD